MNAREQHELFARTLERVAAAPPVLVHRERSLGAGEGVVEDPGRVAVVERHDGAARQGAREPAVERARVGRELAFLSRSQMDAEPLEGRRGVGGGGRGPREASP